MKKVTVDDRSQADKKKLLRIYDLLAAIQRKNGAVTSAVNILPNWMIVSTRLHVNLILALPVTISVMGIENITSADILSFTAKQKSS
jgi:hypothetical protein